MDVNDFRSFILDSGLDVWTWIDMAISVASADHEKELKNRRDGIIQKLYSSPAFSGCQNCDHRVFEGPNCNVKESEHTEKNRQKQEVGCDYYTEDSQPEKMAARNEEEDDEKREILEIKLLLDYEGQTEEHLVDLLQRLVNMNITFKALKETDIGRHVTGLRKHQSNEVRRLVKILVRKWKDTVDEWVRFSTQLEEEATQLNGDKKSPQEAQLKHHIENGCMKRENLPQGDAQNAFSTPPKGKGKDNKMESYQMAFSARKSLHEDYQGTQKAKKQKTAELMDFDNMHKAKKATATNNGCNVPVKHCLQRIH